jgi:uncharacterized coiled-coil protein SlyX
VPAPGLIERLEAAETENRRLIERLRDALAAAEPGIDPEAIRGQTVEEMEASVEEARRTVMRVREALRQQAPGVPAGAPGRTPFAPATALEKIRSGLERR